MGMKERRGYRLWFTAATSGKGQIGAGFVLGFVGVISFREFRVLLGVVIYREIFLRELILILIGFV